MIEYGTITQQSQFEAGIIIKRVKICTQSVKIKTHEEALAMFKELVEACRAGQVRNPSMVVEQYDSGQIKRVIKSWTEVE